MKLLRYRAFISVGVTVLLLLSSLSAAGYYAWTYLERAEVVLVDIEPKYARLLGWQRSDAPLRKAVLESFNSLKRWSYPEEQDPAKAGNDVQQRARHAAEVGGMSIVSSQVLPPASENGPSRIPVSLTVEGSLQSLQATLSGLFADSPALFVDSLNMHSIDKGDLKQPQQVTVTMVVYSLLRQP